jgi:hypothetical protein
LRNGLGRAAASSLAACAVLLFAHVASAGLIIGTYSHGSSNTVVDQSLSRTMTYDQSGASLAIIFTEASTNSLKVRADVIDQGRGGFTEFTGRVVFEAMNGTTAAEASVTLSVDIAGTLEDVGGNATAGWSAILGFGGGSPATLNGNNGGGAFVLVDETLSLTRTVPLGVPVGFRVELRAGVFAPLASDHGVSDFGNSLTFNPDQFFTIHTPGVTANSVDGDWLVNNQLASATAAVPEPSSLALLSAGALSLAGLGCRRKRRSAAC